MNNVIQFPLNDWLRQLLYKPMTYEVQDRGTHMAMVITRW